MGPLSGLRILAVSQYGAGPFGTLHLADLGAEVIKIEDPATGGDVSRYVVPYTIEKDSLFFQAFNRNKKSITLNLKTPRGKELFHRLVRISDVVFSNLRGDLPARLGLDYASLKEINPKIVCCSLSGYGNTGPRVKEPGYDYIIQGMAGFMDLTGEPEAPPTKTGLSLVDLSSGFCGALGLMAGVYKAQMTGVGCDVDTSLLDTAVSMTAYLAAWHLNGGFQPARMAKSAHPTFVPSQNFETADGWMVVMCNKQKFWENLCRLLDRDDLKDKEAFGTIEARYRNKSLLLPILEETFKEKTTSEWMELFKKYDVPAGPVNRFNEVFTEPQVLAREMVVEVDHPHFGAVKEAGCPIKVSGHKPVYNRAPAMGEHNREILSGCLGLSDREIDDLRADGVI